jgi:alkylation response protein AidB-like acyl-CoA dehydrogenase
MGLNSPEEVGGNPLPTAVSVGCSEPLIGANIAFSTYPGLTRGVAHVLYAYGDDWLREHVAQRLFAGEWTGTMGLTEPQAGSAVGDAKTLAEPHGERYRIRGTKIFISGGEQDITENIAHLVLARTPDAPAGVKGLSLFIVPKVRINGDGSLGERNDVVCAGIEEKMGMHGSATCVMSFGDHDACEAIRVGKEHDGIRMMFMLMNEARIGTGLHGLSAAATCYGIALEYAKERIQGVAIADMRNPEAPRVPIIAHPDVRRMLFSMKAKTEGMRALLYKAADCAEWAERAADEEARTRHGHLLEILTPIVKAYCSDVGFDVAVTAVQTMGGAGYVHESGLEQYVRDVKAASIYEGTNGIQALDLIGRKMTREHGRYFITFMDEVEKSLAASAAHGVVGPLANRVQEEQGRVREVAGALAMAGMSGDLQTSALMATPFLTMMGNLSVGWLLCEQAVIAADALDALAAQAGAKTPEARAVLTESSSEAGFYANKLHTAEFFVRNVMVQNLGLARECTDGYRGILQAPI